jgi:predicted nucleic acid-binding protein
MVVADASVLVKWLVPPTRGELHVDEAFDLMAQVRGDSVSLVQPPHWLAEVGAVLARLSPDTAAEDVTELHALGLPIDDSVRVYRRAVSLAQRYGQRVFDTLYHAVALERPGAVFVTADERFFRATGGEGAILRLADWGQYTS